MFRSLSSILKILTPIGKYPIAVGLTLASSIYIINKHSSFQCASNLSKAIHSNIHTPILLTNTNLKSNPQIIAYQLTPTLFILVSPLNHNLSQELTINHSLNIGEEEVKVVKVLGNFDNFTLIQTTEPARSRLLESSSGEPVLFDQVTIIDPTKTYPSIRKAFVTGSRLLSKVIDTDSCKPGSLVLFDNKPVGIISSMQKQGHSTFIPLSVLSAVVSRIDRNSFNTHLGISVKDAHQENGSFVVRIATSSPFAPYAKLGDIITKINNVKLQSPQNIKDLINASSGDTPITVLRDGKEVNFTINTM